MGIWIGEFMRNRQNKKLIIALVVSLVALCSVFAVVGINTFAEETVASGTCGDNLTWVLDDTGTLTISGTGEMEDYTNSNRAPWFDNNFNITEVVIDDGVTSIGARAFSGCTNLTGIILPDSLISIGSIAFSGCTGLTSVTISNNVTNIGNYAFSYCESLTSITIPDSVTSIGNDAFEYCKSLESITIPNSVTSVGAYAFRYCSSLKSITISESITSICNGAFYYCTSLESITIPDSVTSIGNYAFYYCTSLECITIPDGVTSIGENAFYHCTSLECITIPNGVTSIGKLAFSRCTSLTEIMLPDSLISIGSSAFSGCASLTSVTISNNITSIDNSAFSYCTSLECITIPDGVTSIGENAFYHCTSLESIIIPEGVKSIGDWAFDGCSSLVSITIPDSVTSIGYGAFESCNILVVFCNKYSYINTYCNKNRIAYVLLDDDTDRYITGDLGTILTWSIDKLQRTLTNNCNGNMPSFSSDFAPWKEYSKYFLTAIIVDGCTNISVKAFYNCKSLKNITIPESVTSIGYDAFYYCSSLKSITIPESVTSIGGAFYYCLNLESITIPESVISIGDYTFYHCESLKNITIPESVTSIGYGAFEYCKSLESIIISDSVTNIGNYAFGYCTSLKSITIPDSVTSMGNYAFSYCSNVKEINYKANLKGLTPSSKIFYNTGNKMEGINVTIGKNIDKIPSYLFYDFSNLKMVTIVSALTSIGDYAFYNCSNLENITIPNSVTSIGPNAFYKVKSVTYSDKMTATGSPWGALAVNPYIEGELIYYDSNKTVLLGCLSSAEGNVTVPDTVEYVGDNAFAGCENVTDITFKGDDIVFSQDMLTDIGENSKLETIVSPNTVDDITYTYNPSIQQPQAKNSNLPILTKALTFLKSSSDVSQINYKDGNAILFCNRARTADYTVPGGIIAICPNAFANCLSVTVTIPDTAEIERIGKNAFFNSKQYNSWNKSDVLTIGNYVIQAPDSITTYTLPNTILCIADSAFEGCTSLSEFASSGKLKHVGKDSFRNCSTLSSVTLPASVESVGEGAFEDTAYCLSSDNNESGAVYIGSCLIKVDENTENIVIKPATTCIASGAFRYCSKLTNIDIPHNVIKIGNNTFEWCINLKSVSLGNINSLGSYAFKDCRSLESITIPESLNRIEDFAFYRCDALESFTVENGNEKYSSEDGILFSSDESTLIQYPAGKVGTAFTVPETVTNIAGRAFGYCKNLQEISIANDVKLAAYNPFEGCDAVVNGSDYTMQNKVLVSVRNNYEGVFTIPDGVTEIGDGAFKNCTGITGIVFNGVTVIGDEAFEGCTGLKEITFPEAIRTIGNSAFEDCENLVAVTFTPDTRNSAVQSIGNHAFFGTALDITDKELAEIFTKNDVIASDAKVICNHDYVEKSSSAPTCTLNGFDRYECSKCGTTSEVVIPATGHTQGKLNVENVTAPTCEETGTYDEVYYCQYCEIELSRESKTKEPGEHIKIVKPDNIIKATCTVAGTYDEVTYCKICNEEIDRIQKTVSAEGHKPGKTKKENEKTDLKKSIITWDDVTYCSVCGEKYKTEKKQASIKATVIIRNMSKYNGQTLAYKSTITFHADVENTLPEYIHWYVNEKDVGTGESYTVTKATSSFDIKARVVIDGETIAKSETEKIKIDTGFFAKIIAFFQGLFGKLPVYDQK